VIRHASNARQPASRRVGGLGRRRRPASSRSSGDERRPANVETRAEPPRRGPAREIGAIVTSRCGQCHASEHRFPASATAKAVACSTEPARIYARHRKIARQALFPASRPECRAMTDD